MPRKPGPPPKPINLLYGVILVIASIWCVVYLRGGCRKPELDAGKAAEAEGRLDDALLSYKQLLFRYPNDHEAATRISEIYCFKLKRADDCLAWSDRLLAIYPDNDGHKRAAAAGHVERGRQRVAVGDHVAAEADFLAAARLTPDNYEAADELARLYGALHDDRQARDWRAKADKLTPPPR